MNIVCRLCNELIFDTLTSRLEETIEFAYKLNDHLIEKHGWPRGLVLLKNKIFLDTME